MCRNASWYEKDKKVYFLTDADLASKRGQVLKKHLGSQYNRDKVGHGAIAFFYEVDYNFGIKKECTDFSTPDNFPVELITAIKKGKRTQFGVMPDILTPEARENYKKIQQSAWKDYLKICQETYEKYHKIDQEPYENFEKITNSAFWEIALQKENRKEGWK